MENTKTSFFIETRHYKIWGSENESIWLEITSPVFFMFKEKVNIGADVQKDTFWANPDRNLDEHKKYNFGLN